MNIELFVGGSISDYADEGFSAVAKYAAKNETLTVAIYVPRHDAEGVEDADAAVVGWVVRGIESMKRPASARAGSYRRAGGVEGRVKARPTGAGLTVRARARG